MPADLSEEEFYTSLITQADCGMLLDVTNTYSNAVNFGFDPYAQIQQFPLDRVVEIHIACGRWTDGFLEDSHDAPVMTKVWDLLEFTLEHCSPKAILLERDAQFPNNLDEIIRDVDRARTLFDRAKDRRVRG